MNWNEDQAVLARRFTTAELLPLSGRVHDEPAFERALERLGAAMPVLGADRCRQPVQRFAASDENRQTWLNDLCSDADLPSAQRRLLLGVRGGYGISRLLAAAPLEEIARRIHKTGSVLCGHSDFTALQLALLAAALRSGAPVPYLLQGPMLCVDWGPETITERTHREFQAVFSDDTVLHADGLELSHGSASGILEGTLWGGNLSMICALAGTPHMPPVSGGILFIEDVNEHPYRIERMLLQLAQAGILQKQQALVAGFCNDWKASPLDHGYALNDALAAVHAASGIPVFTGLRFGHVADRCSLPVGQTAQLCINEPAETGAVGARLSFGSF